MSTKRILLTILAASALMLAVGTGPRLTGSARALPPAQAGATIPYSGRLSDEAGAPVADGAYDFTFALYAAESGGEPLWMEKQAGVAVQGGAFTVLLGRLVPLAREALEGGARWLEVGVRGPGEAEYTRLAPRQELSAAAPAAPAGATAPSNGLSCWHTHWGETWSGSGNGLSLVSSDGHGVVGRASATSGEVYGVYGRSDSTGGMGVFGRAWATSGANYGVYGRSDSTSGTGVYGKATAADGTNYGVYGYTASIYGYGVAGFQTGYSADDNTFWDSGGLFGGREGVIGISKDPGGHGVIAVHKATSGSGAAILGVTHSPDGWAGGFTTPAGHGVHISTPVGKTALSVTGGNKSAVVRTEGGSRLLYTEESTEVWFTDYGFGKLQNGVAVIAIDPVFAQTVNLDEPYHVFIQPYGDASLYVTNRTPTGFEVRLHDGNSDVEFSYRIVARRLGYEDSRLERAPWADDDPNLYPEKQAIWEAQPGGAP